MFSKQYVFFSLSFIVFLSFFAFGQSVVRLVPYNGTAETELITQIKEDTTANHGILPDRVYQLDGGGLYICQETFYVDSASTLRLRSSNTDKAIVYLYPTGTGSNPQNPPGYFVRLRGGNLEMSNIALSGYFEPVDTNFNNIQGGQIRTDNEGSDIILDSCIFSNTAGQVIRTNASAHKIVVINSIFTNLGALSTSNFGAGKGIDLRDGSLDTLIFQNNTVTNYLDRVIRHYNYGDPLAGTGNLGYALIDHNTIYNGMGFHGLMNLGNTGSKIIITNNLFKDAFAAGEDSTDATRKVEWADALEYYSDGSNRISWIFSAPNDTTQWVVSNNYYAVSDSGQAFFNDFSGYPIVEGSPLSWHINSRLGADSVTAFTKIDDPMLTEIQKLMTNVMRWYEDTTHIGDQAVAGNRTKNTPNSWWKWPEDDMDRKPLAFWIDTLDCTYSTSSPAFTGAMQSLPAGDLNWYPDKKVIWTDVAENIVQAPSSFSLEQNYPNPFNPSTQISFNLEKAGFTTLTVYNILGQKVATLLSQNLSAGSHIINFNASNLSTGVYIYKLESGKNTAIKKMMLPK